MFLDSLSLVFEVADRLTRHGVVLHRLELYRYGAEIPNTWDGQHYRSKAMGFGDPNARFQILFTVRTNHEDEDHDWWMRAMGKFAQGRRR